MDNPLTKFGSDVYQPSQPINLCYDTFAPAAALVRGLFEYLHRADGLTFIPHIPPAPCTAADQQYLDTALRLCDGWDTVVKSYAASDDDRRKRVCQLWEQAAR